MTRLVRRAAGVLLLAGCTPLGLWIYEDPVVTVARVTLRVGEARQSVASPVTVSLAVENRNDYPIAAERVEVSLRMDGVPIGRLSQDRKVPVATDTISMVAMPLALEKQATPQQLEAFGSGTHLFAVRGKATFSTPIGKREVRFAQEGSMVFGQRSSSPSP